MTVSTYSMKINGKAVMAETEIWFHSFCKSCQSFFLLYMFLFWYRSWSASDFVPDKEYRSRAPDNCVNFRRNTDTVYAVSRASGMLSSEPEEDTFPSAVYG